MIVTIVVLCVLVAALILGSRGRCTPRKRDGAEGGPYDDSGSWQSGHHHHHGSGGTGGHHGGGFGGGHHGGGGFGGGGHHG